MNRGPLSMLFCAVLFFSFLTTGCGRKKVRSSPPTVPSPQPSTYKEEVGLASWYGHPYHGRATASGEIYDMEQMTAAHRTLPFQTIIHVENLDTGAAVDVRITDRGPFIAGRIIDLSHAAARAVNMLGPGTAHVRLSLVKPSPQPEPALFAVQVAAFASHENALRMRSRLADLYGSAVIVPHAGAAVPWRVLVGNAPSVEGAETLAKSIRLEQSVPQAFVVRLDPVPIPAPDGGSPNQPNPLVP